MNTCLFTGYATKPEIKDAANLKVLTFRLAVNDRRRNQQTGEWEDYVSFLSCTMFGRRAEMVGGFLQKGHPVTVRAHARQSTWQDKDGNNRSKVDFVIDDIDVHYSKKQTANAPESQAVA